MKAQKRRLIVGVVAVLAFLLPAIADAYTICNTYSDGCTICDFYTSQHAWAGSVEWCS